MIMTAELNSHQRVSYYTGVKLIRHHQSASTANPNNNSTSTNNNNNNTSANSSTSGAFFHQHHNHYPPHPPHHHHQQHPPPIPPRHPGHFHLPCPTGPPHIQHPGGVLHLNNHHGPPHHHHHNGHHYGGAGSNQTTRLYTGSPLIRSTGYHSSSSVSAGSGGGGVGSNKRAFKSHQHRHNHIHHGSHINGRNGGISSPGHFHNQNVIGGSCSSGSSSSSSSNEHLNNIQSPAGSPITQAKLDISPLKLSSSPILNGESSSSNNSSPGPQGSPSPSTASNLSSSSSSSPNSTDGNKDLDHFYFLDEHWKPSSDGGNNATGMGMAPAEILDIRSSMNCARWTSATNESPSPHTVTSATAATTLTMMVDQFFANGRNNNFGSVDGSNNFIGINRDGLGGGLLLRDSNNNIIGGQQPDFNEIHSRKDHYHNSYSGFSCGNNVNLNDSSEGASGLFNFGGGAKFNGIHSSSSTATTVVNVETQIGTFNGQRDLEIRLCFIKGDHHAKVHRGSGNGENDHTQIDTQYQAPLLSNVSCVKDDCKTITAIGDPFKARPEELQSVQSTICSSDSQTEHKAESGTAIGLPISKNKVVIQKS